jgi:hypothetical protein
LRAIERFDERFDELWLEVSAGIGVAVVRDSVYLNWRYAENPGCDCRIIAAEDRHGKLEGFVVYASLPKPVLTGVLLEFVTRPGAECAARLLLMKALSEMKARGSKAAALWSFLHQEHAGLLQSLGFRKREQNLFLQVRKVSDDLDWEQLTEPGNWYISMGDNDSYYGCSI